jgi:PAS domain S-box-containing protein
MIYKALILEDNEVDASLMKQYLKRSSFDFKVQWVDSGDAYEKAVRTINPDIIISDYRLKQYTGLDAIHYRNKQCKDTPLIVVSGQIGEEKAVELIKEGATDFLIKENAATRLSQAVSRAIRESVEKQKRKKAESKFKSSEERFRMLFEHSLDGIIIGNPTNGDVITANDAACQMLGYDYSEIKGMSFEEFMNFNVKEAVNKVEKRDRKGYFRGEVNLICKDGSLLPVEMSSNILILSGDRQRSYYILRDISDRKRAEQKIRDSLLEKETLLTEIHHRVKNNLAVISAMMEMQVMESENEELRRKLVDSQSRIKSIALTHELLYQEKNFSNIDFDTNIQKLVENIAKTINTGVSFKFQLDTVRLNINQALPCSLMINELITNALKHAFNDEKNAVIEVILKNEGGTIYLSVTDNGIGLPGDFILEEAKTIGFTLIKILAKQLKSQVQLSRENGTQFHLQFIKAAVKGAGSTIIDSH